MRFAFILILLSASWPASTEGQVPGVNSVRRAGSENAERHRETDSNAVEIRSRGDVFDVVALTDIQMEHGIDVHRNMYSHGRTARRYTLCTTPCRLVIDRPLLLSVAGIDVPIAPEAQRQRWVVQPEERELRILSRVVAAVGFVCAIVGLVYNRAGANARVDRDSSLDPDTSFRGGAAGIVLGTSAFIAGVVGARVWRGRAVRVY